MCLCTAVLTVSRVCGLQRTEAYSYRYLLARSATVGPLARFYSFSIVERDRIVLLNKCAPLGNHCSGLIGPVDKIIL